MDKATPEPHCSNIFCREVHKDLPGCKVRATFNGTREWEILHIVLSPLHVHRHKQCNARLEPPGWTAWPDTPLPPRT